MFRRQPRIISLGRSYDSDESYDIQSQIDTWTLRNSPIHTVWAYKETTTNLNELAVPGTVLGTSHDLGSQVSCALWNVEDALVFARRRSLENMLYLRVHSCASNGHATDIAEDLMAKCPAYERPKKETIDVDFWHWGGMSANRRPRALHVPKWTDIKQNYSAPAADALTALTALRSEQITTGHLLVMHGPPGTGKTTAIRTMADAWRDWCDFDYVVDPDKMFDNASYLMNVILDKPSHQQRWRLIVVEDAEEFLATNAKDRVGQAVARLLNLGDGMLGQGLNILVLLTTNVHLSKMHEAIIRPGRCLANIEVPKFTPIEASAWSDGIVKNEATLAELFEARRKSQISVKGSGVKAPVGVYL